MTRFTGDLLRSAANSPTGLTSGVPDAPVRQTWDEIHQQALRIAPKLQSRGAGLGVSVAILSGDPAALAPLAQAVWLCGAAVTMLQQPAPRTDLMVWLDNTVRAARMVGACRVIVGEPFEPAIDELRARGLIVDTVEELCNDDERPGAGATFTPILAAETDIAIRQLTSGSTGSPKAIELTYENLWHGTDAVRAGIDLDPASDVMVSWLPASHDMGFIGYFAVPMQLGVEVVIARPEQFLRNPSVWPQLISRYGGTVTSGPNFSYSILSRVLERSAPDAFDLSSLRVASNGAEPVSASDMRRFAIAAGRFGMRAEAITASYGMAETTLGVSSSPHPAVLKVDSVKLSALASGTTAAPASPTETDVVEVVSVGLPVVDMEIRITDNDGSCAARRVGVIEVRGKSVARNYLSDDGRTQLVSDDGWLDTGDLGYFDEEGMLYICGRRKDVIIIGGRNLYPTDIERVAQDVDGVRAGCVAAIGLPAGAERESFAILAESKLHDSPEAATIRTDIVKLVSTKIGYAPREVLVLAPGMLPKTPSGKLRRGAAAGLLETAARHAASLS